MYGVRSDLIYEIYKTSEYRCCISADRSVLVTSPLKTALRRVKTVSHMTYTVLAET